MGAFQSLKRKVPQEVPLRDALENRYMTHLQPPFSGLCFADEAFKIKCEAVGQMRVSSQHTRGVARHQANASNSVHVFDVIIIKLAERQHLPVPLAVINCAVALGWVGPIASEDFKR